MLRIIYIFLFLISFQSLFAEEYFLTLRNNEVNLRQGPSLNYPIKLVYKKKFLPILVIDNSYNFRKVMDHENNSGWIHISQLSKKKAALNNEDNSIIFKKASEYSEPLALIEKGRLFLIKKCKNNWCKIINENVSGWIFFENFWGKLPN